MEVLMVDKDVNLGHLKFIATEFIKQFFEESKIEFRFRPSFFPFTEPSFEVDIKMPSKDKWLEVFGCGMIHPNVLRNADVDPNEYKGFALGMGIERFAMLKYGVKDLRQFFDGDQKWTKHYNFSAFDIPSRMSGLTV
jgi:phenylalanyl-tRNA synthetase alpha chain